jgi:hypothetical protein
MRDFQFNFAGLIHRQLGGNASALLYRGQQDFTTPGAGSFTATYPCIVQVCAWGGGCGGGDGAGGSSGAAVMRRYSLAVGQQITFNVGAAGPAGPTNTAGGATTVSGPGASMTAGGGQTNATGGVATGGEYNRNGVGEGQTGINGAPPGGAGIGRPGGGASGFTDIMGTSPAALLGGAGAGGTNSNGASGQAGFTPGGGGGGGFNNNGGPAGGGKVSIIILATG